MKSQSNQEIARSLRNASRCSLECSIMGVRALNDLGGILLTEINQTLNTIIYSSGETMGVNFHCQKGNNPDHQLRSLIITKWERRWNSKTTRRLA